MPKWPADQEKSKEKGIYRNTRNKWLFVSGILNVYTPGSTRKNIVTEKPIQAAIE